MSDKYSLKLDSMELDDTQAKVIKRAEEQAEEEYAEQLTKS